MSRSLITPRAAMILFVIVLLVSLTQAVWWVVFMAQLTDEKVEIATELGATQEYVERLHEEEIQRQIMIGTEGLFFLVLILAGASLIYRAMLRQEQLKRQQQNFLMAVTHELKTPLASMDLYIDGLKSEKISAEKKAAILPRLKADVSRLSKLVQNILEAGRFERESYRPDSGSVDLTALVARQIEQVSQLPWDKPVEVETELADAVVVSGDEPALARAVTAVLENGLKYSDRDVRRLWVTLKPKDGQAILTVRDDGVGIDPKDRQAVFERFYRVGSELTRSRPGSGLGLYLCREILRAHGGDVTADSSGEREGTTFTINLPLARNNEDAIAG